MFYAQRKKPSTRSNYLRCYVCALRVERLLDLFENEDGILAAETEGVFHRDPGYGLAGHVGDIVQINIGSLEL